MRVQMEGLGCGWKGEGADGRVRVQMEGLGV